MAIHDVRTAGAAGDGRTDDTTALQTAIDACAAEGGVVLVPSGTYVSGTLILKSDVHLHLEQGATILGSDDPDAYPMLDPGIESTYASKPWKALLYAVGEHDITISGEGTIDGNGGAPVFRTRQPNSPDRPYGIRFFRCSNVTVRDVRMRNSGFWMQRYVECDDLMIRGIRVYNHCNLNNDGLDIDSCRRVTVSDCIIDASDDGLCLKSHSPVPCKDVTVTNCVVSSFASPIRFGLETIGGFRNITISNCTVRPCRAETINHPFRLPGGLAGIHLDNPDHGVLEDIVIRGVVMQGVETPIFIRNAHRPPRDGYQAKVLGERDGVVRRITLENISATECGPVASSITGYPGNPATDILLRNVFISMSRSHPDEIPQIVGPRDETARDIGYSRKEADIRSLDVADQDEQCAPRGFGTILPAYGVYVRHVAGVSMENVHLEASPDDIRSAIVLDDVHRARLKAVEAGFAGCRAPVEKPRSDSPPHSTASSVVARDAEVELS